VRKAMGPVLTTGVALVAAAVVVANPVAPPVRDLQISTTQLSTSPEALIPFDKNLLKSISQPSPASNFNAALAQILGALAAEADRIGTEVNSDVSTPLTPASAAASQVPSVFVPSTVDVPPGATSNGTPSATVVPAAVATTPTIEAVVSEVTANTAYLGNKVVEAAYAAVNALVSTPDLIFKAVQAVLVGDLAGAFATIVQAVKAFFDPGLILVGGLDDVVGQYVQPPTKSTPSASAAAANTRVVAPPATASGESATDQETPVAESGSGKSRQTESTGSAGHATTSSIAQPQLTPRSAASALGAGNSSRSAGPAGSGSAEQPKSKSSGADKPGSASTGRSENAGGRGASAGD